MINIKAQVELRGVLLTDPQALAVYQAEVIRGGVEATDLVLSAVVAATPVGETGHLWQAWFKKVPFGAPMWSLIANPMPYGASVDLGSRAHVIAPRNKKALAFIPGAGPGTHTWAERTGSGEAIIRKRVHHPGTKARHFVQKTVDRLQGAGSPMLQLWDRVVSRIVERLS